MPRGNEVASTEKGSRQSIQLHDSNLAYIDEDEQPSHHDHSATTCQETESQVLSSPSAMPANIGLKQLNPPDSGSRNATGNCAHTRPTQSTSVDANHANDLTIETPNTNGGGSDSGTVTKPTTIRQHTSDSEAHQLQHQTQRLNSNNLSHNNKPERAINGGRLNGCCCRRRRPASSSEECVDDDQADNYCQRSENNNNNIKMTITLTKTTVSSPLLSDGNGNERGLQPTDGTAIVAVTTGTTTTAVTTLTTTTTADAIEMASVPVTTATTAAVLASTLSSQTTPCGATAATKSPRRVMIGCSPDDISNESDGSYADCEEIAAATQSQRTDSNCLETINNSTSRTTCNNDKCNNDNTMTRSTINPPSTQSASLFKSPSALSPQSPPPRATEVAIQPTTSQEATKSLPSQSQSQATVTSVPAAQTTTASTEVEVVASALSSSSPSAGHEVLPESGNKFESKTTANSGSFNTSNEAGTEPACNGAQADHNDASVTQNINSNDANQKDDCDTMSQCDRNLRYIALDDLDVADDPYHVLQEYLEHVKNEINQVFELYKGKQNDELTRCTDIDTSTAAVVNQLVADNKLPSNGASCRLNDSDDNVKANETKNSSNNDRSSSSSNSSSSNGNQSDMNSSTSSLSNSDRYLTIPIAVSGPVPVTSEYRSMPTTPTIITSANTLPSLNHGQVEPPPAPTRTSDSRAATLRRLNSQNDYLRTAARGSPSSLPYECDGNGSGNYDSNDDVNIWANKFLRELDNLMGSDKWSIACSGTTTGTMTNGSGGTPANSQQKASIPRPKKHVTIPLQSFNLNHERLAAATYAMRCLSPNGGGGIYLKTLSAPYSNDSNHNSANCRLLPKNSPGSTVLKIEENDGCVEDKCRRQFESDVETIRSTTPLNQSQTATVAGATAIPKRERVRQTMITNNNNSNNNGYLLHNDTTKKGSTSTIWTSEESILRSVGAVDEDNNSTSSSSACEEASGVLSSGKSGISLDSSGLDNDNNESGIGTATPPKEPGFWKNNADNDSLTSSLDALRKIKFQKSSSVASSDDPDLLEVLSLYDETHDDDDVDDMDIHHDDDADHDHAEYETGTFDCYDNTGYENVGGKAVVLREKNNFQMNDGNHNNRGKDSNNLQLPCQHVQKSRSHSLEVSSLLPPPSPLRNDLMSKNGKGKERLHLTLRQEPFQSVISSNFHELPSPSSASLHSGHESLGLQELTTKSNSAPLLLKKPRRWHRDDFSGQKQTLRYSRSQSDRHLAEIEAIEACKWLRAAGFPQYAQMYEDHQFPLDLTNVAKDHTNLENDPLQSLYRRLCILNRCANMRLDSSHKSHTPQKEDSDDENCALSENWTFQPHIRRWSRIGEMGLELPTKLSQDKTESSSKESSPDRYEDDDTYDITGANLNLSLPHEQTEEMAQNDNDPTAVRLRRTGSERLKDGAKALLRRVESIKSRRRKRQNREGIVLSGPQMFDLSELGQRSVRKPDAVYSTPPSPSAVSPMHIYPKSPLFHHPGPQNDLKVPSQNENFLSPNRISSPKRTPTTPRSMRTSPLHFFATPPMPHLKEGKSDDSSSYYSDSQESSSTGGGKLTLSLRKVPSKSRRFLQRTGKVDDIGAHSDSECHQGRKFVFKDAKTTEMKVKKLTRGGSLNLGKDPKKREGFRSASFRTRSTVRKDHKNSESDTEHLKVSKSPVVRWHSFQEEERPHMIFKKCFTRKGDVEKTEGTPFAAMSCGQLQIIRKLALVILTGYMERYCPTHRSGWNWELPKFIKKIKMPDYKDKKVFGVPLLLILQRTGQTLPVAVKAAFRWLQLNALDQIGLFRKSGVKSRIFKLKERIELADSAADCMDVFDTQQAYDVADMLKQYFRDLPESLLTTKMSETFAAIFQHLPPDVRLDAVQCAVLLLPDENREILYALLEFLTLVADNSQYNQMTANNLAVCLAPSLFHNNISTGNTSVASSPRRRKTTGVPDVKELSEAKASHECLSFMIDNYKQIFTASRERISKCNFGYMEESKPVPLEALGEGMQFHNWRGYLYECTSATIKEGREKSRGWITITSLDPNVDIAYKKVGDGHPLRLWRCSTEVEGPPRDVVEYVLKQRASWDNSLLHSQTIQKLDERTEVFQYAIDGQVCTDFCVLRSWQTDLPRGACVIVETSIDHSKARPIFVSVRGVVLASRYLIEPCGSGRSRVMHLARVDIKGKTPEWYNKSYGHISSQYLSRIRAAFKHVADVPESKV